MVESKKSEKAGLISQSNEVIEPSLRSQITKAFVDHQRPLKSFISRFIRRPQDIDDIAQETFVRAFLAEKKGDIQPVSYTHLTLPTKA